MDIIFDIDGTLMDISHRKQFVEQRPKDWKSFRAETPNDKPNLDVFTVAIALQKAGHNIIIASGRNESQREITVKQLDRQGLIFVDMFMRADKNFISDVDLKRGMLQKMKDKGLNPEIVFDDRTSVVDMWRQEGLRAVQVAPGDF